MQSNSYLTSMQQHVFDRLGEVVMHQKTKERNYDLNGKVVNAQIATLIAKGLIVQDRMGAALRQVSASRRLDQPRRVSRRATAGRKGETSR